MTLPAAPRKLLVMELAGLGDNIHLLPALWCLRRQWPDAVLHVMVNAHVAGLFALTPWVQKVWAYPNAPKPGLAGNWRWGRQLRAEGYDCVINTNGSDRSSVLSWLTRAPRRIGRRPADGGPIGWSTLFTQVMTTPYHAEPMYLQKLRCIQQLDIAIDPQALQAPHFELAIDPALRRAAGVEAIDEGGYIHISPFTTSPARELPLAQLATIINTFLQEHPQLRIALSCAPTRREIDGIAALTALLAKPPWRVWPATLDIAELAAVIQASVLHLSGDTGSLHIALMTRTPALAWFRPHRGQREWMPLPERGSVVMGKAIDPDVLSGVDSDELLRTIKKYIPK